MTFEAFLNTEVVAFRALLERAYEQGRADERKRVARLLSVDYDPLPAPVQGAVSPTLEQSEAIAPIRDGSDTRTRAPRGSVPRLIVRALETAGRPLSPAEILDYRMPDAEQKIVVSSVRGELRRGESEGRYIEVNGRWLLATGANEFVVDDLL